MAGKVLVGIPVSVGIAIGKAYFLNRNRFSKAPRQTVTAAQVVLEQERLNRAFEKAFQELQAIRANVPEELKEHASIIDSHLMILKDHKFRDSATHYVIELRLNAEWALEKAVADVEQKFMSIADEYIRERIQDVRLAAERVRTELMGEEQATKPAPNRMILLAHDLTPADTIELEVDKIMAFATTMGGKTSHAGILARSLQIPAAVGMDGLDQHDYDGKIIILDGFHGRILLDPSEEELAEYTQLKYQFDEYRALTSRECQLPGETLDAFRVDVLANIELFEEVAAVIDNGGEGVGLYRTEYSYLNRTKFPEEEELVESYMDLASIMYPAKTVIRTLDIGADKVMSFFGGIEEANPAMGLRAIRFCMANPKIFKTQLRAILRAGVVGNVSVMFPMISGLQELQEVLVFYRHTQQELAREGLRFNPDMPVGIMVELPGAVMASDILAREVDFFSIGTNDLIQYTLGIDRTNRHVSHLYQPLHPAVLRSIKYVIDAGHRAGISVSLCGEMASDPFCVPILMGMQVDSISMNPHAIPGIKKIIRQTSMDECKLLLRKVLKSSTVAENNRLVKEMIFKHFPEELMFYTSLLDDGIGENLSQEMLISG